MITTITFPPVVAAILLAAGIGIGTPLSPEHFTRDTAMLAGVPSYYGSLSTLGIGLWTATAAVCLVVFLCLRGSGQRGETGRYCGWAGGFTSLLALDDALMLHETIGPGYFGIQSECFYAAYGLMAIAIFLCFHRVVRSNECGLLIAAMVFFFCSIGIDLVHDALSFHIYGSGFVEDGFKLLGITGWFGYFCLLAVTQLKIDDRDVANH